MFVTIVDEKTGTEKPGILVEVTHDGARGTVFVLNPTTRTFSFEPRIPNGPENAYIDDDGKHGVYFQPGDPSDFPQEGGEDVEPEPEPDEEDVENTETTW